MVGLDVSKLFEVVGGPEGLRDMLRRHDKVATIPIYNTVQMWQHRGAIPGRYIPAIMFQLRAERIDPFTLFVPERVTADVAAPDADTDDDSPF
jgi:hypothetical protein